jgi:prevent-host-death family protein
MKSVNIHEAKTHLSKLLRRVASGEEVVIAKAGKPLAKLVRFEPSKQGRNLGTERGKFTVPVNFNAPLPEDVLESFER